MEVSPQLLYLLLCTVRGGERCELLQMASLLAVQFGVEHPELLAAMKLPLLQLGQDPTASSAERAAVSKPLSVGRNWCHPFSVSLSPEPVSPRALCLHPRL